MIVSAVLSTMSTEPCIIDSLLSNPFSRRTIQEKTDIMKNGRPCPALPDLKTQHKEKTREYVRSFKAANLYSNTFWLTGCSRLNKLFCWPCLLFSTDYNVWCKTGFDNLNTFTLSTMRHEKSLDHVKCFLQFSCFGRPKLQQDDQQRICDELIHNEKMRKNREVFKRLIDALCCLAKQGLLFSESSTSVDSGVYIRLLQLISEHDSLLLTHLKNCTIIPSSMQSDLIAEMCSVLKDKIKAEVEQTDFVAMILDETSKTINKSQLSVVLRFADENSYIQERFLGFRDVSRDRSPPALFELVSVVLKEFKCEKKLVALTYDGAAVLTGHMYDLNRLVQQQYPCAMFVHCYSHRLNLVLQQCVSKIKECTVFFQTLSGFADFFSESSKLTAALHNFIQKTLPTVAPPTALDFTSRLIITVKEHHEMLVQFFEHMLGSADEWDVETVVKAQGLLYFLYSFNARFLLAVFSKIFSFADSVISVLQTRDLNVKKCGNKVQVLTFHIQSMKNGAFTKIYTNIQTEAKRVPCSRKRVFSDEPEEFRYKLLFDEILENVLIQIRTRFKSVDDLEFFSLIDCNLFQRNKVRFPDSEAICLRKTYGPFFDFVRLKTELSVVYSSYEFEGKSVSGLLEFMHTNRVYVGMPEVYKLLKLVATIPVTTCFAQHTPSALRRINSYYRSTEGQERLSSLAFLSIEKEMLAKLKLQPIFYVQVIEGFVKNSQSLEFIFK